MRILAIKIALYSYQLACSNAINMEYEKQSTLDQSLTDSGVQKVKNLINNFSESEIKDMLKTIFRLKILTKLALNIEAENAGITISEDKFYPELCSNFQSNVDLKCKLCTCFNNNESMEKIDQHLEFIYQFCFGNPKFLDSVSDSNLMLEIYLLFLEIDKMGFRKNFFIPEELKEKGGCKTFEQDSKKLLDFADKFVPFLQNIEKHALKISKFATAPTN